MNDTLEPKSLNLTCNLCQTQLSLDEVGNFCVYCGTKISKLQRWKIKIKESWRIMKLVIQETIENRPDIKVRFKIR